MDFSKLFLFLGSWDNCFCLQYLGIYNYSLDMSLFTMRACLLDIKINIDEMFFSLQNILVFLLALCLLKPFLNKL